MKVNLLRISILPVLLPLLVCFSCNDDGIKASKQIEMKPLTSDEKEIVGSSNEFAFNLYRSIHNQTGGDNLFISPLSIGIALGMTYNGAGGTTKEEIKNTLGFSNLDDAQLNVAYQGLRDILLRADPKVNLSIANSVWFRNGFIPRSSFKYSATNFYDAVLSPIDMDSPAAKDLINNWVKEKTNGKIKDLIEEVKPEHIMFLINAVYFKSEWTTQFDKAKTKRGNFYKEDGTVVACDMMHSEAMPVGYYFDQTKHLIDLPYGNKNFSMTILLPAEQKTVDDIASELNAASFGAWIAAATNTEKLIGLPKFKLEYKQQLNETLQNLGIKEAFGQDANFENLVEGKNNLQISEVLHKAYVEVNEEGTEAAAATSVGIILTSMPVELTINKPFIFLIRENHSGAILFAGKLMHP